MRLLIVSNRLPVTVALEEDRFRVQDSMGGLVSGLSAYLDSLSGSPVLQSDYLWVGWPGLTVDPERRDELSGLVRRERQAYPVFLSETVMDNFYHGF